MKETANVHIEHYFPKGYDPNKEPWLSIRKFHRSAIEKATEQQGKAYERLKTQHARQLDKALSVIGKLLESRAAQPQEAEYNLTGAEFERRKAASPAQPQVWKRNAGDGLSLFEGNTFLCKCRDTVEAIRTQDAHNATLKP